MSDLYSVELVDKIFFHYPNEVLMNMAQDYLSVFVSANHDFNRLNSSPNSLFQNSRLPGYTLVTGGQSSVKLDFSKAVTQGWAAQQVYEAEALIEEVLRRKLKQGIAFDSDISELHRLEDEIATFLNKYCVPVSISAEDLMFNANETCKAVHLTHQG